MDLDWIPSVPTQEVIERYAKYIYPQMRVCQNESAYNLVFYPVSPEYQCFCEGAFIECIHPASSIPTALANFETLEDGTAETRGLALMANTKYRETWNEFADFREDPLLYCYYSLFLKDRHLTWKGYCRQSKEELVEWLEKNQVPFVKYCVVP